MSSLNITQLWGYNPQQILESDVQNPQNRNKQDIYIPSPVKQEKNAQLWNFHL